MDNDIEYKYIKPDTALAGYVDSFWMVKNRSDKPKDIVIIPDGRIDLFFSYSTTGSFTTMLMGLETEPTQNQFPPHTAIYAISFKLLAVEYVLHTSISEILNKMRFLSPGIWGITKNDLNDFDHFHQKAAGKVKERLPASIDNRKQKLFDQLYSSAGSLSVKELSEQAFWSSRQINRYFNTSFGMSLKAYCNILRFRASFQHIAEGKLFPQQNFTDQSHFIKEIKKLSGVNPKDLFKNKNDRFLQFLTLPQQ